MKMRILLVGFAMGMATPLFGVVNGSNVFGQIECTSGFEKTIVAIPWVSTNATAQTIKVAEIIQTTNLKDGTMALHKKPSNGMWYGWHIVAGKWVEMDSAGDVSGVTPGEPSTDYTVARGSAIWLIRPKEVYTPQGGTEPDYSAPFYVYGKYDTNSCNVTITRGTANNPTYTLICAPFADKNGYKLNDPPTGSTPWDNCADGDSIRLQTGVFPYYKEYFYKTGQGWCKATTTPATTAPNGRKRPGTTSYVSTTDAIPAGEGFWYVSNGGAGESFDIAW